MSIWRDYFVNQYDMARFVQCKPVGIPVMCTILYIPPHLVVVPFAPTERVPVLSPACLSVSRRKPRQVFIRVRR